MAATRNPLDTLRAFRAYVECALWSSTGDDDEPLDAIFGPDDLAPEAFESMRKDVADFLEGCDIVGIDLSPLSPEQVGHDFWLTRNRHGAGFWDRGLGDLGDKLTVMAHGYGESDLYVGDGQLWVSP